MLRFVRGSTALLIGATVLATACDQPTEPPSSSPSSTPSAAFLQQFPGGQNPDQHALGQAIPAFGGLFLENGVPTVFLTDPSQRGAVENALSAFLAHRGVAPSAMQVRQGRFSYRQLENFFARTRTAAFDGPGGVFADLDEANNRVTLGVEDAAAAARARAEVATLGLPDGAVTVEIVSPILPMQTLRDRAEPIPAGVQIHFGMYLCSIGIIADVGGQLHFVTASHCTNKQGGVEGTEYYQPLSSTDATVIGIEVKDPDYFSRRQGPCPYAGAKCRFSDAALVESTNARAFSLGAIADPSSGINWDGTSHYTVTTVGSGNGVVGQTRRKVGRTTGLTTGTVSASCVDTGVSGSNIVLLCQDWVSGGGTLVGAGDSGSDVFAGSSSVTWWGILWGGSSDGSTFVYSPASNVQAELGTLDVTGGGSTPPPPETLNASFTYSCRSTDCAFDGSGSTGASSWGWAFGDGDMATGITTTHSYAGTGSFDVILTVGDGATIPTSTNTSSATQTINCGLRGKKVQCK